uniref:Uncharacterized protein n=1 Tax=Anopheles atroparvus TaxID=41427 RepID=A0A182IP49_ANOAO
MDFFESTDLTMSDGGSSCTSRSRNLLRNELLDEVDEDSGDDDCCSLELLVPPPTPTLPLLAIEPLLPLPPSRITDAAWVLPDHFSNFSSSVLMRSLNDMPRSLESLDVELTDGARGGGLAGTISLTVVSSSDDPCVVVPDRLPNGTDDFADATAATGGGLVRALLVLCRLEFAASEERVEWPTGTEDANCTPLVVLPTAPKGSGVVDVMADGVDGVATDAPEEICRSTDEAEDAVAAVVVEPAEADTPALPCCCWSALSRCCWNTCTAKRGSGSTSGSRLYDRAVGIRRGSLGSSRFSGRSSHRGVPGRDPSALSPPLASRQHEIDIAQPRLYRGRDTGQHCSRGRRIGRHAEVMVVLGGTQRAATGQPIDEAGAAAVADPARTACSSSRAVVVLVVIVSVVLVRGAGGRTLAVLVVAPKPPRFAPLAEHTTNGACPSCSACSSCTFRIRTIRDRDEDNEEEEAPTVEPPPPPPPDPPLPPRALPMPPAPPPPPCDESWPPVSKEEEEEEADNDSGSTRGEAPPAMAPMLPPVVNGLLDEREPALPVDAHLRDRAEVVELRREVVLARAIRHPVQPHAVGRHRLAEAELDPVRAQNAYALAPCFLMSISMISPKHSNCLRNSLPVMSFSRLPTNSVRVDFGWYSSSSASYGRNSLSSTSPSLSEVSDERAGRLRTQIASGRLSSELKLIRLLLLLLPPLPLLIPPPAPPAPPPPAIAVVVALVVVVVVVVVGAPPLPPAAAAAAPAPAME